MMAYCCEFIDCGTTLNQILLIMRVQLQRLQVNELCPQRFSENKKRLQSFQYVQACSVSISSYKTLFSLFKTCF